jgi:ATP-dependent Lon protease
MELKKASPSKGLSYKDLRWVCNPKDLVFESTEQIEPIEGILGQERALNAIKLGVNLKAPGYNIYIAGLSGTGKATTVENILKTVSSKCPDLKDYCYVNNFQDPDKPILLLFPAGQAKVFRQEMQGLINFLKQRIPQALDSEKYLKKKKQIVSEYTVKEQNLINGFESKIKEENLSLGQIQIGEAARPEIIPIIDQKPVPVYQLDQYVNEGKITKETAQEIVKNYSKYQEELIHIFKRGMKISQDLREKLSKLEREEVEMLIKGAISAFKDKYTDPKILEYINQVEDSILNNLHIFKGLKPEGEMTQEGFYIDYFREYDVNIILDNSLVTTCPIVVEISPTYTNLFGTIEKVSDGKGGWYADFTKIKAGSLLKANGGYIVLHVNHIFEEPGVWRTLKKILTYSKLEIQDLMNFFQFQPSILKPEPVDIDVKVILIGSNYVYSILANYEDDFKKIFKVKADFDYEIKRSNDVIVEYVRVIKKMIKEENLLEFDKTAIAYLLELSAKYAGQKEKLTSRFSVIADIARESNYWALDEKSKIVNVKHVRQAYNMAKERHGLYEEKVTEMINDESILIDTSGEKVGQVNGLAFYGFDFYTFGKPTRITATVSIGNGNIINVEREAGMSGKTYDKGVLIIGGYFKETFGQNHPLSFSANLVFEQSYGGVDGDSASCAEIFAIVSTIAGIPISQSIAVTGSVNQKGDVQPIGGVNEKIEGFYDTCKEKGFNKKHAVIIPKQNVKDLMLKEEIIESVKKGEFKIYPIERIEEGIEIITGIKAGKKTSNGLFGKDTVYGAVQEKLKLMYDKSRPPKKDKEEKEEKKISKKKKSK